MAFKSGDIISYRQMCDEEQTSLQRGMNFRLNQGHSVILMSVRPGAPYNDRLENEGRILIYEGHDIAKTDGAPDPKTVDQPLMLPSGKPTQNGLFFEAALKYRDGRRHVVKFKLQLLEELPSDASTDREIEHTRFIPSSVKLEVWKRDNGRCVICGDTKNLHFDHIIPFSKGGTSLKSENIQLLCAKHNLEKHDRIE
jgi:hypothetical protein